MAKVSMLEASRLFDVARPTILKHIKQGKITAEKVETDKKTYWQIDMSELSRVYKRRGTAAPGLRPNVTPEVTNPVTPAAYDLQAEIRVLQAQLEAEKQARELVERHLSDMRAMLPAPERRPQNAVTWPSWWPFRRG